MLSPLLESLVTWDNLWSAFRKAARGKRSGAPAAGFEHQVADKLAELQRELAGLTYRPGAYVHFTIHEPKRRKISAAPFRDRVAHHALCNVIEPLFEAQFIPDSYANRIGKGTHRALDRLQTYARRWRYVLRADIVQHFPALDHAVLRAELARVTRDEQVLTLVDSILAGGAGVLADAYDMVYFPGDDLFAVHRPRGLPIGNLTSQFWSNCMLNPFDHFVTRELGCNAYLRYVDDFVLFSNSKRELYRWKAAVIDRLAHLRLTIHTAEAQVLPVMAGILWLGFVVYPTHRRLKRRNAVHFTRRLEHNLDLYQAGRISFADLDASVQGWINHVRFADTWGCANIFLPAIRFRPKLPKIDPLRGDSRTALRALFSEQRSPIQRSARNRGTTHPKTVEVEPVERKVPATRGGARILYIIAPRAAPQNTCAISFRLIIFRSGIRIAPRGQTPAPDIA